MAWVIMWLPFSRNISAMPLIIKLSDSVASLVKMISFGVALISEAICWRAVSTASSPAQPNEWLRLAALAHFSVENGRIGSATRGSTRGGAGFFILKGRLEGVFLFFLFLI